MSRPVKPTDAEFNMADVHAAEAVFAGNDECSCRVCKRVRVYHDAHTVPRIWMLGGAL